MFSATIRVSMKIYITSGPAEEAWHIVEVVQVLIVSPIGKHLLLINAIRMFEWQE